jgi:hypothetical protein
VTVELRGLLGERNRLAHADIIADVPDPAEIMARGGRAAGLAAVEEAERVELNFTKAGPQRRPVASDDEMTRLRQRVRVVRLDAPGAALMIAEATSTRQAVIVPEADIEQ